MKLRWPTRPTVGRLPHVEVVVPCYNYGHYLPAAVEAIVRQPHVTTQVTILDDKSTDDSAEVAERLAAQHDNVRLIRNEVNLGAVPTFNKGVSQADSDYVVLISSDDQLAPGALGRATALMEAHPSIGLVYGKTQKFLTDPVRRPTRPAVTWTTWDGDDWIRMQLRRAWSNIASPEAVVRTSVQHEVGPYDEDLPFTHDALMWLKIAAVADVGHVNGVDQAYYRRHPSSMSMQVGLARDAWERWRAYDRFLSSWGNRDAAERLHPHVRRRLADEVLLTALLLGEESPLSDEAFEEAFDTARRIDRHVVERARWADLEALRAGRPAEGLSAHARAAVRAAAVRARWPRWHRYRYFG